MYRVKLGKIRLKCSKHPKYDPVKKGEAFRASCTECEHIYRVYCKIGELRRMLGEE